MGTVGLWGCLGTVGLQGCLGTVQLQDCSGTVGLQDCSGAVGLQDCSGTVELRDCGGGAGQGELRHMHQNSPAIVAGPCNAPWHRRPPALWNRGTILW